MFDTPSVQPSIATNRSGQMTDDQRKRAQRNVWSGGCLSLVSLGIAVPLGLGGASALFSGDLGNFDSGAWFGLLCFGVLVLGFVGGGLWMLARAAILWQDTSEGRVEQGEGQVTWAQANYRAEIQGRRLVLTNISLGPGPYRFYYLPRTGRVLSAEKLTIGAGGSADDELRSALAQANKFPPDSLTDLRNGHVGAAGPTLIRNAWVSAAVAVLVVGAMLAFFAWVILSEGDTGGWFVLIPAGVFGLVLLGMVWSAVNVTRDVMADQVLTAQGVIQRVVRRSNRSVSYYYRLGKLSFSVSAGGYNALVEGRTYRIFYLPRSKKLVGIEPVA